MQTMSRLFRQGAAPISIALLRREYMEKDFACQSKFVNSNPGFLLAHPSPHLSRSTEDIARCYSTLMLASYPGTPATAIVGKSARTALRFAPPVPRTLNLQGLHDAAPELNKHQKSSGLFTSFNVRLGTQWV
jgi:hypothetical protein